MCIPQNTTSVDVKPSIKNYTPHALDGLLQERKDKLNAFLDVDADTTTSTETDMYTGGYTFYNNNYTGTDGYIVEPSPIDSIEFPEYVNPYPNSLSGDDPDTSEEEDEETPESTKSKSKNMKDYVCTKKDGTYNPWFEYNGFGIKKIKVPKGVQCVGKFTKKWKYPDYDVESIYIPASVKCITYRPAFAADGNDNWYCSLYECRIRDTDMAKEMVELSKHNILEQAGTTMIAQANQTNQGVLSLLQ